MKSYNKYNKNKTKTVNSVEDLSIPDIDFPLEGVVPVKKEKYKKPKKGERLKFISKKSLERRVNQCKRFLDDLETDREDIVQLRKLVNVFLIREMDESIEEKRKKGTDNALWDKKIKDAKDEFMNYINNK